MKRIILVILICINLGIIAFLFTGCTLQIETTDNSVTASVDGDTTEKVDNIIDWIKERLNRLFKTDTSGEAINNSQSA